MILTRPIRRFWRFMKRENIHYLFFIIVSMIVLGTLTITYMEPNVRLVDGLWWSFVTLTTVGYGDIYLVTLGGRSVAVILMFFGVGLVGLFSATLASSFVEQKIKDDQGMSTYNFKDHIILCEWNHQAWVIFNEFRADPQTEFAPIVVIADIEHKPINDENLHFIQGNVNDDTLKRANLAKAKTAVILGDDKLDLNTRDAKAVLTTLTIESLNPAVYTIVELVDESNVRHCERANADEIIVTSELNSSLIARTALNHGISKIVSELVRVDSGSELYKIKATDSLLARRFMDVFTELKEKHESTLLAVQKGEMGQMMSNPPANFQLEKGDYLVVVAREKPHIS